MQSLLILVCLLSGFVGSGLGFGGAMLLAPACFWLLPPAEAVMSVTLLSNLTNLLVLAERRTKQFDRPETLRLTLATLPGILLGIFLLQYLSAALALLIAGLIILTGVGLRLIGQRLDLQMPAWPVYPVGLGCGIFAALSGLAALAPAWMLLRNLKPAALRDSLQLYYLIVGSVVLALGLLVLGTSALLPEWWVLLGGAVGIFVGHFIGQRAFERLSASATNYDRLAMVALALIGGISVIRAFSSMV